MVKKWVWRIVVTVLFLIVLSSFVFAESPTKLLMHMDGADALSPYARNSISLSGQTHHETDQSQIGSSSIYFDGSDTLTISDSEAIELGEDNFTIDFWVRSTRSATNPNQFVFAKGTQDVDVSYYFTIHGGGYFEFGMIGDSGWIGSVHTYQTLNPSANTWYHIAVERDDPYLLLFVDGKLMDNETISGAPKNNGDGLLFGNVDGRSYYLSGYVDEFRISKDVKWKNNFTVPSSPHSVDENTTLLIHSDHSDGSTAIVDSAGVGVHPVTMNGNPILNSSIHVNGSSEFGGSIQFDGDGDYLSIPDSDDWYFADEDFTIDFWIDPSDSTTDYDNILGHWTGGTGTSWVIEFYNASASSRTVAMWINGAGPVLQGSTELPTNQFTHVAVVRKGADLKLYIDGVQDAYYDISTTSLVTSTSPLLVGTTQASLSLYAKMDELRISKGVARWDSDFSVPTEPYEADENTTLLLHFDGDKSLSNHSAVFNGDADMSASQYKFDGSYYFDGTGDYLVVPASNDWDFGTEEFTIDLWFKMSTTGSNSAFYGMGSNGNFRTIYTSDGRIRVEVDGIEHDYYPWSADTNWHHLAIVRSGTGSDQTKTYLDGNEIISFASSSTADSGDNFYIGNDQNGNLMNGYIDEVRITKGLARWTSEFTPPSRPYNQPVISSFAGDSTDLSSVDTSYVENMKLAVSGANVHWNGIVNVDGADLDSNIKMGSNFVSVNAAALDSSLNSSANVTLDVEHCNELTLYYAPNFYDNSADIITNGQICNEGTSPACTNIVCNDGVVTFTAQHFDSYTGSSGAPVPEFSDYALILAITLTIGGLFFIRKK